MFSFCLTMNVRAERDACDFASNIEVGVSKKFFKRLELGFKESVSFDQNSKHLDKVSSKVDVSCTVVRKIFKVGVSYYAISKHREENYFFNQRFQGYTNVKYEIHKSKMFDGNLGYSYTITYDEVKASSQVVNTQTYTATEYKYNCVKIIEDVYKL